MKHSPKLLVKESPLILLPVLAKKIGSRSAAIVLQQIHYWTQNLKCGCSIDGVRWIYNTYIQWAEQLLLSVSTIKRAIALLKSQGLILVEQHDKSEWNHRNYYRIDYEALKALQLPIGSECTEESSQIEPSTKTDLHQSSIPDITPEDTSNKTTTQPVVAPSLRSEYPEPIQPYPVCPEPPVKQVKFQLTAIDHLPIISGEKINEMRALNVDLSPALRIAVAEAAAGVYEGAIALLKQAKADNKVNEPTPFLLSAIRGRWHVPTEQTVKDKQARFIEWRKASKDNDAAAKYSVTKGDRIEISADGETWIEWEEKL